MRLPHPFSPHFGVPSARAMARRRMLRANSQLATLLLLDNLESRLLMAGAASQLFLPQLLSPLTSVNAAVSPAIKVTVADATGTTVTTDTSTVVLTLAQNPAGGSLTIFTAGSWRAVGSVTATAVAGVATFSNLSFSVAGQYVINVNDGSLAGTQSNLFTVLPMATHLAFQVQPGAIGAGSPFSPVVQVLVEDASNSLVTTDSRAISLSLNTTAGTLTGLNVVNAQGGIATFTGLSVTTLGTYTLVAKDTSTTGALTSATSISFTVTAGAASALRIEQQPANTPQGGTFGIIVDVTDSLGNIVTSDTSTVTLTVATPIGTPLSGTTTATVVNGQAVFSGLSISQPDNYTLQAVDGSLTAVTSASFAIVGPATKLGFVRGPVPTTVGTIMTSPVVVAVEDANGNVVSNDSSSVMLAIATGPVGGTISGTTAVAVVNGTASFSGLSFSQMGTYTLLASDGLLTNANSGNFIINGTAAQLAFTQLPFGPTANTAFTVVVEVEDTEGNRVVTDNSTVTVSLDSGPAGGLLSGTTSIAAVNGTASFTALKLSKAGTYTLAAADGILAGATSSSFIVSPAASQLVFLAPPSNFASGAIMASVKVEIIDSLGHVATTNTSTVTLVQLSGPHNGSISGSLTMAAVNGVATFTTLTGTVQGTYQFMAIDGGLGTDVSQKFSITMPAYKLQWATQPQSITAGQTLNTITAWVEDQNKNVITSDTSIVTLATASGPAGGTIIGNATAHAVGGEVFFTGISFTKAGTYKLVVTDGTLLAATSHTFTVLAAASTSQLTVTQSPATTLVGNTFSPNVIVAITDTFGNVIKTNSKITLAVESSDAGGTLKGSLVKNANNGLAAFNNLSVNLAGNYTFVATDTALANGTSATFATVISQVNTLVAQPSRASSYTAGKAFTLNTHLSAVVRSSVNWAGGTAELINGSNTVIATSAVTSSGNISFAVTGQTAGTYTWRVHYLGDTNHLASLSPAFNVLVVQAGVTLIITPSARQLPSTGTLTLSALVRAGNGVTLAPSGTVLVEEHNVPVGTITLSGTSASSSGSTALTGLATGSHNYTLVYVGDSIFKSSTTSLSVKVLSVV